MECPRSNVSAPSDVEHSQSTVDGQILGVNGGGVFGW